MDPAHYRNLTLKARDFAEAIVAAFRTEYGADAELEPLARGVEQLAGDESWSLASELVRQTVAGRGDMDDADTSRQYVAAEIRAIAARERRPVVVAAEPDDPFQDVDEHAHNDARRAQSYR